MWITRIVYFGMNFISMTFFHLRLKQGNNDAERALQDMMGGKLEQKKECLYSKIKRNFVHTNMPNKFL